MSSAPQGPYVVEYNDYGRGACTVEGPNRYEARWPNASEAEQNARMLNAAYHEGRESVMAERGDLLYTDNSAVVARLSAENERLRAELAKLKAE